MPKRTGRPWQRRKARIIRRDGGVCHLCGDIGADSADHIIPWSQGGPDTDDNLAAVHHNTPPHCNRVRGDRSIDYARTALGRTPTGTGWTW